MDATEDEDLKLQKSAEQLIRELRTNVPHYLWKSKLEDNGKGLPGEIRLLVRKSKTDQLIKLLEPFQESPQLLDPHLAGLVDLLTAAFTQYLHSCAAQYSVRESQSTPCIIPLPRGICQILSTLCKIRGQKVIRNLLNNEAKWIEPMVDALECWSRNSDCMVWEEKYVMMLWLSHLMLTPFNLDTIASVTTGISLGTYQSVELPETTPFIAQRLVHVASLHLSVASKERDAAAMLLVRVILRPDMSRLELHIAIIQATLAMLNKTQRQFAWISIHGLLGNLSVLAKFMDAAELPVMQPLFTAIHKSMQHIQSEESMFLATLKTSPLARRLTIKIHRSFAVASLKLEDSDSLDAGFEGQLVESMLEDLFETLQDKDTSVRIAASKAMSVIALQLGPDKTFDIVEEIMNDLVDDTIDYSTPGISLPMSAAQVRQFLQRLERQFDGANAARWHGSILTLAQLIYHGSLPQYCINDAISVIGRALQFEQRSSLGVSGGVSVRDAACFGLWSIARRYTTDELCEVQEPGEKFQGKLQRIANSLLLAATLDSSGNIRRGASAALQELVGRHPDTISCGIVLIQIVDYHAIALRSRAMEEVAVEVCSLGEAYHRNIWIGLLSWRGIGSTDVHTRRGAAKTLGILATKSMVSNVAVTDTYLCSRILDTPLQEVEQRHGLLLAFSDNMLSIHKAGTNSDLLLSDKAESRIVASYIYHNESAGLGKVKELFIGKFHSTFSLEIALKSDLVREASCWVISTLAYSYNLIAGIKLNPSTISWVRDSLQALEACLSSTDPGVLHAIFEATRNLCHVLDKNALYDVGLAWTERIRSPMPSRKIGLTIALGALFSYTVPSPISQKDEPPGVIMGPELATLHSEIIIQMEDNLSEKSALELKCYTLTTLANVIFNSDMITNGLQKRLLACLEDYTIDQRGDIGSKVRIEAIKAVAVIFERKLLTSIERNSLAYRICALAAEKLDKVRSQASLCLHYAWNHFGMEVLESRQVTVKSQPNTVSYFWQLLNHGLEAHVMPWILIGYATSAGAGSESVRQASRSAFVSFMEQLSSEDLWHQLQNLIELLDTHTTDQRMLSPIMSFLAFLFEARLIPLVESHTSKSLFERTTMWTRYFVSVQKAHYKSNDIPRIEAAVSIYQSMAVLPVMRRRVLVKLCQMLAHAYPKIRNSAADSLFILTQDEVLLGINWSAPVVELEDGVGRLKDLWMKYI